MQNKLEHNKDLSIVNSVKLFMKITDSSLDEFHTLLQEMSMTHVEHSFEPFMYLDDKAQVNNDAVTFR